MKIKKIFFILLVLLFHTITFSAGYENCGGHACSCPVCGKEINELRAELRKMYGEYESVLKSLSTVHKALCDAYADQREEAMKWMKCAADMAAKACAKGR